MTRARTAVVVKTLAALAVAAVLLGALVWFSTGGRWYDVRTASMGQAAPVGSLLLVQETTVADVHVGDVVSFHQADSGEIYTHRVVEKDGRLLQTKGDINAVRDPWQVDQAHLVGKVSSIWPVAGYALRGLPLFLGVLGVVWLASSLVRRDWRGPVRTAGLGLAFAVACLVLQPWVGLDKIGVVGAGDDARFQVVSTGVLPVKAVIEDAASSPTMRPGEVATVKVPTDGTRYSVSAVPSLTGWWWVVVIGVCLFPLLLSLLLGVRAEDVPVAPRHLARPDGPPEPRPEDSRDDQLTGFPVDLVPGLRVVEPV